MADTNDAALDTAAAFLKALADHAVNDDADRTKVARDEAMAWMRHLTVAGEHPETQQKSEKRDFGGARRFVQRTLREGHAIHLKTAQQFRDTVWGFASEMHGLMAADGAEETVMRDALSELESAVAGGNTEALRRATIEMSRRMFHVLEERRERQEKNALSAAKKLPELLELIQNSESATLDRATGLLTFDSLVEAAEKVHVLSSIARAPVSVVSLSLGLPEMRRDTQDAFMAAVAPAVSRTFLCRTDLVGRNGPDGFAVVSAGCDMQSAERVAQRALAALQQAAIEKGAAFGKPPMEPRVRVGELTAPIPAALRRP